MVVQEALRLSGRMQAAQVPLAVYAAILRYRMLDAFAVHNGGLSGCPLEQAVGRVNRFLHEFRLGFSCDALLPFEGPNCLL